MMQLTAEGDDAVNCRFETNLFRVRAPREGQLRVSVERNREEGRKGSNRRQRIGD
jgi:hypothetical protein